MAPLKRLELTITMAGITRRFERELPGITEDDWDKMTNDAKRLVEADLFRQFCQWECEDPEFTPVEPNQHPLARYRRGEIDSCNSDDITDIRHWNAYDHSENPHPDLDKIRERYYTDDYTRPHHNIHIDDVEGCDYVLMSNGNWMWVYASFNTTYPIGCFKF